MTAPPKVTLLGDRGVGGQVMSSGSPRGREPVLLEITETPPCTTRVNSTPTLH